MVSGKTILRLVEKITIFGRNENEEEVVARIDTGATASSVDIKLAEKLNLEKMEQIKLVKSASGIKRRSMVKAKIKLKGEIIEEEFTLADRSHMTYDLLIGQNVLKKGNFLIDPSLKVLE